jgi:hypothetical protein
MFQRSSLRSPLRLDPGFLDETAAQGLIGGYIEMPDRDSDVGIPAVEQVIAVVDIGQVNVVGVIPVVRPVLRPWVNSAKPIALILETWISAND